MAFEVMHRHGRNAERGGQSFGKSRADEQGAGQSRALRVGDRVKLAERVPAIGHYLAQQGYGAPDVIARGELGDDAAVGAVHQYLRVQGVRQ